MLDFVRLQQQLNDMVIDQHNTRRNLAEKLGLARDTADHWSRCWQELVDKMDVSRTSWLLAADLREPFNRAYAPPPRPAQVTVTATDGSQIFPDRHELSPCHLINVGVVVLHYGTGERPRLTSQPWLFYKEQDTYREWNGKVIPIGEEVISALRGVQEIETLTEIVAAAAAEQRITVGLTDGTLILWKLEGKPRDFQHEILRAYMDAFDRLRTLRVPLLGYISQPTSADVVNVLRVALCPEYPTNCDVCPYKSTEAELPCEPIAGVTDAHLYSALLRPGERSPFYRSSSSILSEYGAHWMYFAYLHVGAEVVRLEAPRWVVEDADLLALAHAVAYDQAQKGQGYPVSLSEAHEQAVIRGSEREQFYRLVEQFYVKEGVRVSMSQKSLKKRQIGV